MLSQFSREIDSHVTLADLPFEFSKDVYPVGRLDADSEGLLILTSDKSLNDQLLNPKYKQPKTYWAQVEGIPTSEGLQQLEKGITITVKGKKHKCLPSKAYVFDKVPTLPERIPPIRIRKSVPDTWISITLIEGKNRQVRKMCAAIGCPVLRLVRVATAGFVLGEGVLKGMVPGDVIFTSVHLDTEK